jgi:hypothetical protein
MSGLREQYLVMRMQDGSAIPNEPVPSRSLRNYLYDKYVYRNDEPSARRNRRSAPTDLRAGDAATAWVTDPPPNALFF